MVLYLVNKTGLNGGATPFQRLEHGFVMDSRTRSPLKRAGPMLTKKLNLILIVFIFLVCLSGCRADRDRPGAPLAVQGVMDLTQWNFEADGPVDLSGQWEFHWRRFLPPGAKENDPAASPPDYITVPGAWNGQVVSGKKIPGEGFATYGLKVRLPRNAGPLAFKVLDAATSLALYANGRLLSSAGRPAETREEAAPGYKPEIVGLNSQGDEIDITIHSGQFLPLARRVVATDHIGPAGGCGGDRGGAVRNQSSSFCVHIDHRTVSSLPFSLST